MKVIPLVLAEDDLLTPNEGGALDRTMAAEALRALHEERPDLYSGPGDEKIQALFIAASLGSAAMGEVVAKMLDISEQNLYSLIVKAGGIRPQLDKIIAEIAFNEGLATPRER